MNKSELLEFIDELVEVTPEEANRMTDTLEEEILEDISIDIERLKNDGVSKKDCRQTITKNVSDGFQKAVQFLKENDLLDEQSRKDIEELAKKAKKTIKEEIDFQYGPI